jgi:hypothetical protein
MPQTPLHYHLMHPGGPSLPGDPNAAFYLDGVYHLHYILAHPWRGQESFSFVHVTSPDMLHWTWQPTALQPDFTGHGMFSGTGFVTHDGQPAIIYHGQGSGRNQIVIATDCQLTGWQPPYPVDVRNSDGSVAEINHWDPDCFVIGDTYYAISGGEKITIGSSGGRISAESSYDPNFGPNEQPVLTFSWSCNGIDMSSIPSSLKTINIPAITSGITCTVTVGSAGASISASVDLVPVVGLPPSLTISSSLPRVASTQNLALTVRATPGVETQYRFEWLSSKNLAASDVLTSLQAPSLVVKGAFFADATSAITFTCRVTNSLTNVSAETSMSIAVN